MPACLPEQLLWSGVGCSPSRRSSSAAWASSGQWAPQSRCSVPEAAAGEQVRRPPHVGRRAAVRGAGQGEVGVVEPIALRRPGEQERHALEGFGGRAEEGRHRGIALEGDQPPLGRDRGHGAKMPGLRQAVAGDRGDRREQGFQRSAAIAACTDS